jgi:glycosyltransferase involved in cell wall biosynthesis
LIGTFEERKGFLDAIVAFKAVNDDCKFFSKMLIFGEGTAEETSRMLFAVSARNLVGTVEFCGYAECKEKMYERLDLVIVPSRSYESFGLVQVEGYLHGIPVVVSDVGGLPEVAAVLQNPFVFRAGSVTDLVRILRDIQREPSRVDSVVRECQTNAARYFSIRSMIDGYRANI